MNILYMKYIKKSFKKKHLTINTLYDIISTTKEKENKTMTKREEKQIKREERKNKAIEILQDLGFETRIYDRVPNRVVGVLNNNARIYVHILNNNFQMLVKSDCVPAGTKYIAYKYMLDAAITGDYKQFRNTLTKVANWAKKHEVHIQETKEAKKAKGGMSVKEEHKIENPATIDDAENTIIE